MMDKELITYAIINRKTKKFVYGTDYRNRPLKQRTSFYKMLTYEHPYNAQFDLKRRECGKNYSICRLEVKVDLVYDDVCGELFRRYVE